MLTPLEVYRQKLAQKEWQPDQDQEASVLALQQLYEEITGKKRGIFTRKKRTKGLYLWGGVGRGKSMLMDMFFEALPPETTKRRVHFHEFMIETHNFLHKARQDKEAGAIILKYARKVAAETDILCFDEFHVTDIADAMILGRLFAFLFRHGVVVVATSNWPPDRLYEDGLQRALFIPFIELLKERLTVVELNGAVDYRLQCLREDGVYFTPLGAMATKKADHLFSHLTDHARSYHEILTIKGRDLDVSCVAKGIARFSFAQLCERPLGAEDYLRIARQYHTVFLEGVPRLKYDRRNEAKRLMALIDALYEQRAKLVMTADAPPEALYQGRDHGFEFQRTVSRLIEMQGAEYLGR